MNYVIQLRPKFSTRRPSRCAAGPPSAASRASCESPPDRPCRRAGQQRKGGDRRGGRFFQVQSAEQNPRPPGGPTPVQTPTPSASAGQGRPRDASTMSEVDDMIAAITNVPLLESPSGSGSNRSTACTSAIVGRQTTASGRNLRSPLRTFLPMQQGLTTRDGGSVQSRTPRKEPRRERGACRKRGRGERGSGGVHNRGDRR